jgi:hypothetical protein
MGHEDGREEGWPGCFNQMVINNRRDWDKPVSIVYRLESLRAGNTVLESATRG